jgi:hypothetical protein
MKALYDRIMKEGRSLGNWIIKMPLFPITIVTQKSRKRYYLCDYEP